MKSYVSSCAPSCEFASNLLQKSGNVAKDLQQLLNQEPGQLQNYKFEVQDFSCCESDLCNGAAQVGRSPLVLAGGLLLSLGPALLWTLL